MWFGGIGGILMVKSGIMVGAKTEQNRLLGLSPARADEPKDAHSIGALVNFSMLLIMANRVLEKQMDGKNPALALVYAVIAFFSLLHSLKRL